MRVSLPLTLASLLLVPALAQADAVSPEPTDCVDGSVPVFCHGPPTCLADTCTSDLECAPDHHCVQVGLCTTDHGCGGRAGTPIYLHVESECNDSRDCDPTSGTSCNPTMVCRRGARVDAGPSIDVGGTDSGTAETDTGSSDSGGMDSGATIDTGTAVDAPASIDTGRDSGTGPSTAGGCCSAVGRQEPGPALLGMLALALVLVRRRSR